MPHLNQASLGRLIIDSGAKVTWYARRGSKAITDTKEFLSHLAMASRLENVGVLLGAGASKGAGGGTMYDVWSACLKEQGTTIQWLYDNSFITSEQRDEGSFVNIENLLDRLNIADADMMRRGETAAQTELHSARAAIRREIAKAAILDRNIWSGSSAPEHKVDLADHMRFLTRLVSNRQTGQAAPWVFTTNYDLAVEWAAEALRIQVLNGFTGLHHRKFVPNIFDLGFRNVATRGEARFGTYNIYLDKLHGSLSWGLAHNDVVERAAESQWSKLSRFVDGATDDWPGLLIFPESAKYMQTTGFVYSELIRRFGEFLSRSNTCLIVCGYGFGDEHVNRLLRSALQNPTLQVIIYLPELDRCGLFDDVAKKDPSVTPSQTLKDLVSAQLPQVTFKGAGEHAYFSALAEDLPEPALIDESSAIARRLESLLGNDASS